MGGGRCVDVLSSRVPLLLVEVVEERLLHYGNAFMAVLGTALTWMGFKRFLVLGVAPVLLPLGP